MVLSKDMSEIKKLDREELHDHYSDLGYSYKGYHLEIQVDEDPGERYYYYGSIYDPEGKELKLPKTTRGGNEDFLGVMGNIKADEFKAYIDSLI